MNSNITYLQRNGMLNDGSFTPYDNNGETGEKVPVSPKKENFNIGGDGPYIGK